MKLQMISALRDHPTALPPPPPPPLPPRLLNDHWSVKSHLPWSLKGVASIVRIANPFTEDLSESEKKSAKKSAWAPSEFEETPG